MAFGDLIFVFVFLPVCLLLYILTPGKFSNVLLLIFSLLFFAWGTPEYLVLMLCSLAFNYAAGREISALRASGRRVLPNIVLITSVLADLALLGYWKYAGFLLETVNAVFGTSFAARELPLPVGLSFFTFSLISYLADIRRGKTEGAKDPLTFALFVTFFPKLASGPIVAYPEMEEQLAHHPFTWRQFGAGARCFLVGLSKKILLANTLADTFYTLSAVPPEELTAASAWLCALSYAFMLYFDFSGYSDMAVGLGRMFGFRLPKNFDYPYLSSSISEFWRRWHITLGAWFREYVYIPLGGSRVHPFRIFLNLMVVWLLTGLWHGAGSTFLIWGLYHGTLVVLEKLVLDNVLEKIPKPIRIAVTFLLVVVGWVFFFSQTPVEALTRLSRMFFFGGAADGAAAYYAFGALRPLLLGVLAALPLGARLGTELARRGQPWTLLSVFYFAALFLLCVAGMMNETYSASLYAQF